MKRPLSIQLCLLSWTLSLSTSFAAQVEAEPPGYVDCPFCADPTHIPQDAFSIFTSGDNTLTCETAFALGTLRLPQENCTFWQDRGTTICHCAANPPEPNDCTLCEDGSALPAPRLEGAPGKLCAQLQVDAKRDFADYCIVWQQTMGLYCGCENPLATAAGPDVCRLCGEGVDLPDPVDLIPLLTDANEQTSSSCGQLEFSANLPGASCDQFQLLYGAECCRNVVLDVDDTSEEDAATAGSTLLPLIFTVNALLMRLV